MGEAEVVRDRPKERNPRPQDDRHARDDQPLNEARRQKALDRHAAVDIDMAHAPCCQTLDDLSRRRGHE